MPNPIHAWKFGSWMINKICKDSLVDRFVKFFIGERKWVVSSIYEFPELEENSIHTVIDSDGRQLEAIFCFGEGEYWWRDASTGKEVAPLCYLANK